MDAETAAILLRMQSEINLLRLRLDDLQQPLGALILRDGMPALGVKADGTTQIGALRLVAGNDSVTGEPLVVSGYLK